MEITRHPFSLHRNVGAQVRSLVNWLGCAVGGSQHEPVVARAPGARGLPRAIAGNGDRPPRAAGHYACRAGERNQLTRLRFRRHASAYPSASSGAVASAPFALAEPRRISGLEFRDAFIVGVEVESRIANAIYKNHYFDWYITGTTRPFGAAAAVGMALGLNEERMTWALGIAANEGRGCARWPAPWRKVWCMGVRGRTGSMPHCLRRKASRAASKRSRARAALPKLSAASRTSPACCTAGRYLEDQAEQLQAARVRSGAFQYAFEVRSAHTPKMKPWRTVYNPWRSGTARQSRIGRFPLNSRAPSGSSSPGFDGS